MTNADKIRSMTDEALAQFVSRGLPFQCSDYCEHSKPDCFWVCTYNEGYDKKLIMKWLKEEVEE